MKTNSNLIVRSFALAMVTATAFGLVADANAAKRAQPVDETVSPSDVPPPNQAAPKSVVAPAPAQAAPIIIEPAPAVIVEQPGVALEERCIKYHHHPTLRRTGKACGTQEVVLAVKEPCTGCCVAVPICLPCSCTDEPKICEGRGLLGRNVVTYEWCCGYRLRIVFDRCGDVIVHSYGR